MKNPLEKIKLLKKCNEKKIIYEWNDTSVDFNEQSFLFEILSWADKTPEKIALEYEENSYSYAQLIQIVNSLVKYFTSNGVKQGHVVLVRWYKNDWYVFILIALLSIGAIFSPVDIEASIGWIKKISRKVGAKFLLTYDYNDCNQDACNELINIIICNEDFFENIFKMQSLEIEKIIAKKNDALVYINYTSGSTGEPKSVAVTQENLNNLLFAMKQMLGLNSEIRWLSVTAITFDIAYLEVLGPLLVGGTVIIPNTKTVKNIPKLLKIIVTKKINIMQATPSLWRLILGSNNVRFLHDFKFLTGGEALTENLRDSFLSVTDKFWNLYGPTETTIWSTAALVSKNDPRVSIGRPIANTKMYILNNQLKPVAIGEPGEIFIGGKGVSQGYYQDVDHTNKYFLKSPFDGDLNSRIFRTGDIGCYLPDGRIVCIGRTDREVKVNGMRVNLSQLEYVIEQSGLVGKCAVIVNYSGVIELFIRPINTIKCQKKQSNLCNKLIGFLHEQLPRYMLPKIFTVVDELPLTKHGKINYAALKPGEKSIKQSIKHENRLTSIDQFLSEILVDIFNLNEIDLSGNFYSLGGSSLQAMQLSLKIYESYRLNLNVSTILSCGSMLKLSDRIGSYIDSDRFIGFDKNKSHPQVLDKRLTFMEQDIYISQEKNKYNSTNTVPVVLKINGKLNVEALEYAVRALVSGCAVYRNKYYVEDDKFNKTVDDVIFNSNEVFFVEDIRAEFLERALENFFEKAFFIDIAPIIKFKLLKISNIEYVLLISMHHVYTDDITIKYTLEKLAELYNSYGITDKINADDLFLSVDDNLLNLLNVSYVNSYDVEYWKNEFAFLKGKSFDSLLLNKKMTDTKADVLSILLSEKLTKQLFEKALDLHTTMSVLLLGLFRILFYKYTSDDNFIIALPISIRQKLKIPFEVPGLFVNTLPINIPIKSHDSFCELLERIYEIIRLAEEHSLISNETIAKLFHEIECNNIIPATFTFEDPAVKQFTFNNLEVNSLSYFTKNSNFPISILSGVENGRLRITVRYLVSHFEKWFIKDFLNSFMTCSKDIVSNNDVIINKIQVLSPKHEKKLINISGINKLTNCLSGSILEQFNVILAKYSENIAVIYENSQLTYKNLDQKSSQLAELLNSEGVSIGNHVGMALPQSSELIITYLALIKLGATYVYIDLTYPKERIEFIASEAKIRHIIINDAINATWLETNGINIINLKHYQIDHYQPFKRQLGKFAEESIAYISFTSGSTGVPKGVKVRQNSIVTMTKENSCFSILPSMRIAQVSNLSFDASVFEIWGALLNGASIVLINKSTLTDPEKLFDAIKYQNIDMLFVTTQLLNNTFLVKPNTFSNLDYLLFGGNKANARIVQELMINPAYRPNHLVHCYGPTEATCFTTAQKLNIHTDFSREIPIGHPLNGRFLLILDEHLNLLPMGAIGEIYIGGDGIADGYLNETQTQEKFIYVTINSISRQPVRLYQTGDFGRYSENGELIFCRRYDEQIKRNGYRIELGEIEAILQSHPKVLTACAISCENNDEIDIIAYFVLCDAVDANVINDYVQENLPKYMFPNKLINIEKIPVTSMGKPDKEKLMEISYKYSKEENSNNNSVCELEERVLKVWLEILNVKSVSYDTNFFDAGGTSLLALKLCAYLNKKFNCDLKISDIFQYTTVKT